MEAEDPRRLGPRSVGMTGHREIPDPASPLSHPAASAEKDWVPTGGLAELDRRRSHGRLVSKGEAESGSDPDAQGDGPDESRICFAGAREVRRPFQTKRVGVRQGSPLGLWHTEERARLDSRHGALRPRSRPTCSWKLPMF